jgi:putative redox protein
MYIDRKEWDIPEIFVSLNMIKEAEKTIISRDISFGSTIDEETKNRLLLIAEKCPVSKILKGEININTTI